MHGAWGMGRGRAVFVGRDICFTENDREDTHTGVTRGVLVFLLFRPYVDSRVKLVEHHRLTYVLCPKRKLHNVHHVILLLR